VLLGSFLVLYGFVSDYFIMSRFSFTKLLIKISTKCFKSAFLVFYKAYFGSVRDFLRDYGWFLNLWALGMACVSQEYQNLRFQRLFIKKGISVRLYEISNGGFSPFLNFF
jgi:hypothetical protein